MEKLGQLIIGDAANIDEGVRLAYLTPRKGISDRLVIGAQATIRSGCVVYAGTTIGDGLQTGHNVVIREENEIGDSFNIWNNSVIDYGCKIGSGVKIHCNCYVAQFTVIEDGVFLAPGVTIANDIYPGDAESASLMKGPTIKAGAQIGVNATILPYVTIGERSLIGSGAVVTKDVPPDSVVYGNPATVRGSVDDLQITSDIREKGSRG